MAIEHSSLSVAQSGCLLFGKWLVSLPFFSCPLLLSPLPLLTDIEPLFSAFAPRTCCLGLRAFHQTDNHRPKWLVRFVSICLCAPAIQPNTEEVCRVHCSQNGAQSLRSNESQTNRFLSQYDRRAQTNWKYFPYFAYLSLINFISSCQNELISLYCFLLFSFHTRSVHFTFGHRSA